MMAMMLRRLILIATVAALAGGVDLATKAVWTAPPPLMHQRSTMWLIGSCVLLTACLSAAATRSRLVIAAAAVCAGGLVGNVTSALSSNDNEVPDPLVLGGIHHGVAFNLADVFFIGGMIGLAAAAVRHATAFRAHRRATAPQ